MNLYIFTGAPASGKSTLAKDISKIIQTKYLSKDEIKISLFNEFGFNNHGEKKKLSLKSEEILHENIRDLLKQNKDVIVDNNYKNFDAIKELKYSFGDLRVYCIYLTANYDVLAIRYNERISSGNRDQSLNTLNVYPIVQGVSIFHKPIDKNIVADIEKKTTEKVYGDYIHSFDTTTIERDYNKIMNEILKFITEK